MPFINRQTKQLTEADEDKRLEEVVKQTKIFSNKIAELRKEEEEKLANHQEFLGASNNLSSIVKEIKEKKEELEKLNTTLSESQEKILKNSKLYKKEVEKLEEVKKESGKIRNQLVLLQKKSDGLSRIEEKIGLANIKLKDLENNYNKRAIEINKNIDNLEKNKEISEKKLKLINYEIDKEISKLSKLKEEIPVISKTIELLNNKKEVVSGEILSLKIKFNEDKDKYEKELLKLKDNFNKECKIKVKELENRECEVNERERLQKEDRIYLIQLKNDLESTYKIKIKRVI